MPCDAIGREAAEGFSPDAAARNPPSARVYTGFLIPKNRGWEEVASRNASRKVARLAICLFVCCGSLFVAGVCLFVCLFVCCGCLFVVGNFHTVHPADNLGTLAASGGWS